MRWLSRLLRRPARRRRPADLRHREALALAGRGAPAREIARATRLSLDAVAILLRASRAPAPAPPAAPPAAPGRHARPGAAPFAALRLGRDGARAA